MPDHRNVIARSLACLFVGFLSVSMLHAQATPTASRQGSAQVGVAVTAVKPDYGQTGFQSMETWMSRDTWGSRPFTRMQAFGRRWILERMRT